MVRSIAALGLLKNIILARQSADEAIHATVAAAFAFVSLSR
jgi:hypothetical protein